MFRQKNVGAKWVLVLWAVEWAWHPAAEWAWHLADTYLRCVRICERYSGRGTLLKYLRCSRSSRNYMPNPNFLAYVVPRSQRYKNGQSCLILSEDFSIPLFLTGLKNQKCARCKLLRLG